MAIQKIKQIIVVTEDNNRIIYNGVGTSNCQNNARFGDPENYVVTASMRVESDKK